MKNVRLHGDRNMQLYFFVRTIDCVMALVSISTTSSISFVGDARMHLQKLEVNMS